jgi:hypothetical protein
MCGITLDTVMAVRTAARNNDIDMVKYLIRDFYDPDADYLLVTDWAIEHNHADVIRMLIARGFNIAANEEYILRRGAAGGVRYLDGVKFLLSIGCDPSAADHQALEWAVESDSIEMTELLLSTDLALEADYTRMIQYAKRFDRDDMHRFLVDFVEDSFRRRRALVALVLAKSTRIPMDVVRVIVNMSINRVVVYK